MKLGIEFSRKLSLAYESMCKPLCHELKLPQTAFDILMFLANNPEFKTARDIVEVRKLKANLVSVNIDKLVNEGYLIRKNVEGDRRKVQLLCTDKAQPIISRGQQLQEHFLEQLFADIDDATRQTIFQGMQQMELNLNLILEDNYLCIYCLRLLLLFLPAWEPVSEQDLPVLVPPSSSVPC